MVTRGRRTQWKLKYYKENTDKNNPRYLTCLAFVKARLEDEEDYGYLSLSERKHDLGAYVIVIDKCPKTEFMRKLKKLIKKTKE